MQKKLYNAVDWSKNYREHPEDYIIGRGEFGVLMYEPYKSELLPLWQYKDKEAAEEAALAIYNKFLAYLEEDDFPGADMARKYLRMGYTRAMRYAKYPGGKKYKPDGSTYETQQWADPDKREAALVFKAYWDKARNNAKYQRMYDAHKQHEEKGKSALTDV